MYAKGQGVPQDYKEAVRWFRLAAEQGDAGAQYNLGWMYAKGQGVPQDKVLAYALYNLSAAGDPPSNNAAGNRDAIVEQMSPREIEAGQALTRELAQPGNFGKALDAYLKRAQAAKPKD
jgi:TPR repeat protein